jgi:Protein of unknown function (DUF4013)
MVDPLSPPSLRVTLKFPFQAKEWIVPFIIGTALIFSGMILPIIPVIFVYGYLAEVMRMSIQGQEMILPAWKNWGNLFKDGLRCIAVGLVYLGPAIVLFIIGMVAYFSMFVALIAVTPESSANSAASALAGLLSFGAMGILFLCMFFGMLLFLAGAIPLPTALAHFISNDKMGAAFHLREWGRILRNDKWGYLIAWLLVLGMMGIFYFAFMLAYMTFIFCFVGILLAFPAGFYIMVVSAALFGQVYREGTLQPEVHASDATINP